MLIIASAITKAYRGNRILDGISLGVRAGQVHALIGPSGAGKSTLLKLIAGIEGADSGCLEVLGNRYVYPSNPIKDHQPWPDVTLVFQGLCLWPHLTLLENIMLPLRRRSLFDAGARADKEIERFKLSSLLDRFPNQVSGGQRQLVALCRALALQPKVLLLDEVTAALDVEHIRTLRQAITDLKKENTTVIMVSHSISLVRKTADAVVFMDKGLIHEAGSVSVLAAPTSGRLRDFLIAADELVEEVS